MKRLKVNTLTPLYEFVINSKSIGIIKFTDFVDLGLSVLWAKCNIGAEKETDIGHYYQWGGLEPMDDRKCTWETYPFNNKQSKFEYDYFDSIKDKVCPNNILDKEYDIAYQTYKGNVHMPTKEQYEELIIKTESRWIDNYNNSGTNGRLFTGKNDNSIFIPFAGVRFNKTFQYLDSCSYLWSSSINTEYNNAWDMELLFNNYHDSIVVQHKFIYYGFSVRAVKDK